MRETMKNIIYSLLITTMITSCGDVPEEYSDDMASTPSSMKLNINNAKSIFMSSSNRTSSESENSNQVPRPKKIFKYTEDGAVEEVTLTLEDGSKLVEKHEPLSIDSIGGYVIFTFGPDVILPETCYLDNTSNNNVHNLGGVKRKCPVPQGFSRQAKIYLEDSNLYFRYADHEEQSYYVQKVNLEDMSKSMYSPDTADVMNFMVDSFGNMVYTDWVAGEVILRKKDGELYTLLSGQNDATASTYWIGLDGNNYIFDVNNDKVYKITIGTDGVVRKTLYKSSTAIMVNADTEILKLKNNIVFVTYGNYSNITVDDGYTFETMNIPFDNITNAKVSNEYVYVSGNEGLIKIDLFYDTITEMYNEGTYEIYDFDVTSNDSITFSALRISDGKSVLGEISEDGNLTITFVGNKITNLKLVN